MLITSECGCSVWRVSCSLKRLILLIRSAVQTARAVKRTVLHQQPWRTLWYEAFELEHLPNRTHLIRAHYLYRYSGRGVLATEHSLMCALLKGDTFIHFQDRVWSLKPRKKANLHDELFWYSEFVSFLFSVDSQNASSCSPANPEKLFYPQVTYVIKSSLRKNKSVTNPCAK